MPRARAASSGNRSPAAVRNERGVGGAVEECDEVEDFAGLERGAFDVQLLHGDGDVRQAVEVDADGRAWPVGCGAAAARR